MKKLTAGIFATILGLTAIDAYAALPAGVSKVATTNYVDGAMGAAVTSANTYTDTKVGEIVVPDVSGFATTTYVDTQDAATLNSAKTYAESEAGAAQAAAIAAAATDATSKANTAEENAKAYTDAEIGEIGEMTVKAYVDNAKDAARYDDTALAGRVTTAEGKITAIETQQTEQNTEIAKKANSADLAAVATSGSYNDLTDQPTIPSIAGLAQSSEVTALAGRVTTAETDIDTLEGSVTTINTELGKKANSADLAAVATSGSYNDLTDQPTIPSIAGLAQSSEVTALAGRVTTAETDIGELEEGHQAQATQISVVETDVSNIKAEQTTQNNSIKALQDAAGNYVTWDDVENTYPAAN